MTKPGSGALTPLRTLRETARGSVLPLSPRLTRLYGRLRIPRAGTRPHVISNFVTTLDGVVSLGVKGHASGGDISGFSAQDRMVMGLLRAIADVVIVGAGTLGSDRRHIWTAERICPELASEFRKLRAALGKRGPPLVVVVSGSGRLDLALPLFSSGEMPALIVTTLAGAKALRKQQPSDTVGIVGLRGSGAFRAAVILAQVRRVNPGKLILVEGGPHLLATFYAEHLLDEQFLTIAPQLAGRDIDDGRLSMVMGWTFAPKDPLWGTLVDIRQGGSHLFLRYAW